MAASVDTQRRFTSESQPMPKAKGSIKAWRIALPACRKPSLAIWGSCSGTWQSKMSCNVVTTTPVNSALFNACTSKGRTLSFRALAASLPALSVWKRRTTDRKSNSSCCRALLATKGLLESKATRKNFRSSSSEAFSMTSVRSLTARSAVCLCSSRSKDCKTKCSLSRSRSCDRAGGVLARREAGGPGAAVAPGAPLFCRNS
mmetsp:Transcript_17148/g.37908  ORF Transcript_17148/g.37908 Transcript_17148/m.37908 type:complete len:202 (-) Transcript_17148:163-768(-)